MSNTAVLFSAADPLRVRRTRKGDAPASNYVFDTFSGAATGSDLVNHVGELGTPWFYYFGNRMNISSAGRAYASVAGNRHFYRAAADPGVTNWDVEAPFFFFGGSNTEASICGQMVVGGNMYFAGWKDTAPGPRVQLYRTSGGVDILLGSSLQAAPGAGSTRVARFRKFGARLVFSWDGVTLIDVVDAAPLVTPGWFGIGGSNSIGGWAGPGDTAGIHFTSFTARRLSSL